MKKSILLMLPFALGLAACSGGSPLDKGNIITPKFMERNFVDTKSLSLLETSYEFDKKVEVGEYQPAAYIDDSRNFWLFQDGEGNVGVYSVGAQKFLIEAGAYAPGVNLGAYTVAVSGRTMYFFWYTVDNEDGEHTECHLVDELGNEAASFTSEVGDKPYIRGRALYEFEKKDNEYFVIFPESYNDLIEPEYVVYNLDGTISRKGKYSEYTAQNGAVDPSVFQSTLEDYGHPELAMVRSHTDDNTFRYSFYNLKEGKYVASYSVNTNGSYFFAGDFMVSQELIGVEERATEYDLYFGGDKYNVVTTKLNITNGNKEELDSKVIFALNGAAVEDEILDEKGVIKYHYFANAKLLKDDKTLDSQLYGYFLDENLNVAADISGISWNDIEKVGDYYVDTENNIVYDGKLNEVLYAPNAMSYYKSGIVFRNTENKYGLMGYDGKIIEPALHDFFMEEDEENGFYYYGNYYRSEFYGKAENGKMTVVAEADPNEWVGYAAGTFGNISKYEDAEGENYYIDCRNGSKDYKPYEPAETDTLLGLICDEAVAFGGTVISYANAYQTADGALYFVISTTNLKVGYQTIAE